MVTTKTGSWQKLADVLDVVIFGGLLCFLVLMPFHLVIKKLVPDPVGTYWKEGLLGILLVLWLLRSALVRRSLLPRTGLDWAVLFYVGLLLLRFVLDYTWAGTWGLYVSVMYLPLFWLVPSVLASRPRRLMTITWLLVAVGAGVSVGGLAEFIWNVPLWPSPEMVRMHGFPGVFIYGTNIRRVYFTFDSPTTLANTLAILLPLALTLLLISRRIIARLAAGLAAVLIAACIVVTFSRGIWVASVFSLAVMGAWILRSTRSRGSIQRLWKPLLAIGGSLVVIGLAWGIVWFAWHPWQNSTYQGVVELSATDYRQAPTTGTGQDLLQIEPDYGDAVLQDWSLLDPIAIEQDARTVIYQHPPETGKAEYIYTVQVPENGAMRFAIALAPDVWSPAMGDGVSFQVYVKSLDPSDNGDFVFQRYVNPKDNTTDRRWRNFLVDLSPWAGKTVHLSLITNAGPVGDWSFDWAGWAAPAIVNVEPGYFAASDTEDAIVRHTSSIMDWAQDETNRDRLAAWSQGLNAWRAAPLWGNGLGTTGVAALRARPKKALVPESQVLKALVELGPLGLLALAFLWFQIARTGLLAYRAAEDRTHKLFLMGVLTSLLVVFVEGWVYQNLEVKQVNAYFWTLVGVVAFLAGQVSAARLRPEPLPVAADEEPGASDLTAKAPPASDS